jgi:multidrug resistance protein, MATE family
MSPPQSPDLIARSREDLPWAEQPRRELLRLSGPLVLQLLSFSAMSFVDTVFVGRLGAQVLGAIGIGSLAALTIVSFGSSIMVGARVPVGNDVGRGALDEVRAALPTFLWLGVLLGLVSGVAGLVLSEFLPGFVSDRAMGELSAEYLRIRSLSLPASVVVAAAGQWLGAQGNTRSPMVASLVANGSNAILNYWLVIQLGLGLRGSAIATLLAQFVELLVLLGFAALSFRELKQHARISPSFVVRLRKMVDYFQLGLATGLERVLDMLAFSSVPLLLSYAGAFEVGVHQIVLQVSLFAFLPTIALGDATTTLVAQAVGADRTDLLRAVRDEAFRIGFAFALLWGVACALFRVQLVATFTSDPGLVPSALKTLLWAALLQIPNTIYNVIKGWLRGLQDFRAVALCATVCAWVVTPPLTYVLGVLAHQGASGAWQAFFVEVVIGLTYLALRAGRILSQKENQSRFVVLVPEV